MDLSSFVVVTPVDARHFRIVGLMVLDVDSNEILDTFDRPSVQKYVEVYAVTPGQNTTQTLPPTRLIVIIYFPVANTAANSSKT